MGSNWDIGSWKRAYTKKAERGLDDIARFAESEAVATISGKRGQELQAIDTGTARASIKGERRGLRAFLIGLVEYFVHIELGTEKMRARPILRTTVRKNKDKIVKILQKALNG